MKITKRGKYTTRDGRKVRIYAVDGEAAWPVHGAIFNKTWGWASFCWWEDGSIFRTGHESNKDLIPAPRKRGRDKK